MVQAQFADSRDLIILLPLMGMSVRTSATNPVQHAQKNRPLDSKTKMPLAQQLFENRLQLQPLPEPLKNEHRSDGQCLGLRARLSGDQCQGVGGELAQTAYQSVDGTLGLELLDSAQSGQDALARLVVGADRLDQCR